MFSEHFRGRKEGKKRKKQGSKDQAYR